MSTREFTRAVAPVTVIDPARPDAEPMQARDLGLGGLFLYTEERWPPGTEVPLEISYGTRRIPIEVVVLRHEEEGVAFAFESPGAKLRGEIRGLLAYLFATGAPSDERRSRRRREVSHDVVWMDQGREHRGRLKDISLENARIIASDKPAIDARISVFLPVRSGKGIDDLRGSSARVVRHSEKGFAVRFLDASVAFHEAIAMLTAFGE